MHTGRKFMERFWYHVKNLVNKHTSNRENPHGVTKAQVGLGNVENKSSATIRGEMTSADVTGALGYTPLDAAKKGVANGVAELDTAGKVPSAQLPSFVDDVLEGYLSGGKFYEESTHATLINGETGKIYIDLSSGKTYRWSGSTYAEISESLALGETSSTAYRGDKGKTAYDHAQETSGNPHRVTKSDVGLGNVPNVATNDQTPTFTVADNDTALQSGEKLSVSLGKIARAILSMISLKKEIAELNSNITKMTIASNKTLLGTISKVGSFGIDISPYNYILLESEAENFFIPVFLLNYLKSYNITLRRYASSTYQMEASCTLTDKVLQVHSMSVTGFSSMNIRIYGIS